MIFVYAVARSLGSWYLWNKTWNGQKKEQITQIGAYFFFILVFVVISYLRYIAVI